MRNRLETDRSRHRNRHRNRSRSRSRSRSRQGLTDTMTRQGVKETHRLNTQTLITNDEQVRRERREEARCGNEGEEHREENQEGTRLTDRGKT